MCSRGPETCMTFSRPGLNAAKWYGGALVHGGLNLLCPECPAGVTLNQRGRPSALERNPLCKLILPCILPGVLTAVTVAIPPRSTAVPGETTGPPGQRDRHRVLIEEKGRLAWQAAVGYGKRALVGCDKTLIGSRLRARGFATPQTEVAIGVAVLHRLLSVARAHSVCKQAKTA